MSPERITSDKIKVQNGELYFEKIGEGKPLILREGVKCHYSLGIQLNLLSNGT